MNTAGRGLKTRTDRAFAHGFRPVPRHVQRPFCRVFFRSPGISSIVFGAKPSSTVRVMCNTDRFERLIIHDPKPIPLNTIDERIVYDDTVGYVKRPTDYDNRACFAYPVDVPRNTKTDVSPLTCTRHFVGNPSLNNQFK